MSSSGGISGGGGGGGGSPVTVLPLPEGGKELAGPNTVYIGKPSEAVSRTLSATAKKGDSVTVKIEATGHNVTVEAGAGKTIEGKATIEVGTGVGAENNSVTLVYDGEGTWWSL